MKKVKTTKLTWNDVPKTVIKKIINFIGGDGWTIWAPHAFTKLGAPKELINKVTRTHKSDGTPMPG